MSDSVYEAQHGYYLEEISPGMSAIYAKTITEADVTLFAGVSGDTNPLHLNEAFASQTRFKTRVVHGMLTTSLWSTLVGTRLPGPGSAYVSQEMKFIKPVHVGETVTARMTVAEIDQEKQRVVLDGECHVGETLVAFGRGVVWVPRRDKALDK
ncbi:MAG: MaoC family dehydratase [Deltaproteobacteria bacterium]|nr:MaoC family dehydratase [Deltaproteobacteria bacterium]